MLICTCVEFLRKPFGVRPSAVTLRHSQIVLPILMRVSFSPSVCRASAGRKTSAAWRAGLRFPGELEGLPGCGLRLCRGIGHTARVPPCLRAIRCSGNGRFEWNNPPAKRIACYFRPRRISSASIVGALPRHVLYESMGSRLLPRESTSFRKRFPFSRVAPPLDSM
jgi:hypothetical protein